MLRLQISQHKLFKAGFTCSLWHAELEPNPERSGYLSAAHIDLVCTYWSIASAPLSRANEPDRL